MLRKPLELVISPTTLICLELSGHVQGVGD